MKFWKSWLLSNKPVSMSSVFCLKFKGVWIVWKNLLENDCVVSRTNKNLNHKYPLQIQNWTALKYILKEVLSYLSFVLEHPNLVLYKHKPNYLHPSRWSFQAPLFQSFPWLWLFVLVVDVFQAPLLPPVSGVSWSNTCSAATRRDSQLLRFNLYYKRDVLMLHVH